MNLGHVQFSGDPNGESKPTSLPGMHMSMSCYTYVWFWDNLFSTSQLLPCTTPHLHQDLENPNRKWNDWETTFYVLFWGSFVLVGLGEAFRPDHGPESWARDEVAVRDSRRAQDDEVKWANVML